ncbi:hypothetical protein BC628DRAFT_1067699 [Trametes gibbosa]|nr:hypothetical protein BC628DRAFT_1067699 [Trametes gibbosa]
MAIRLPLFSFLHRLGVTRCLKTFRTNAHDTRWLPLHASGCPRLMRMRRSSKSRGKPENILAANPKPRSLSRLSTTAAERCYSVPGTSEQERLALTSVNTRVVTEGSKSHANASRSRRRCSDVFAHDAVGLKANA